MEFLARDFSRRGHAVVLATVTPSEMEGNFDFQVRRQLSFFELWRLATKSDVCLCANVSLRGALPLFLSGVPIVISHQGWYRGGGNPPLLGALKNGVARLVTNVFASRAIAARIPVRGIVIPNGYDTEHFRHYDDVRRSEDLIFVGRLVSDKGVDVLLSALHLLAEHGRRPTLTVIGAGPDEAHLRALVSELGLAEHVRFTGRLAGEALAREISRHKIMVVPSSWEEPFGIVALEGIACGCVIVGTDGGGLPEAIGPCGLLARRGDAADLALQIDRALLDFQGQKIMRAAARDHLSRHTAEHIVTAYLRVLGIAAREVNRGTAECTGS